MTKKEDKIFDKIRLYEKLYNIDPHCGNCEHGFDNVSCDYFIQSSDYCSGWVFLKNPKYL